MQHPNEESLKECMKDGDHDAFHQLIRHYHDLLFRTLYTKINDQEAARDLVQDSFVRIWQKRHLLKPQQSFFALLVKIGINLTQDELRRRKVRENYRDHVTRITEKPSQTPDQGLLQTELENRILWVLAKYTPERCRQVFALTRLDGLSNSEVAELLGLRKKTVENQLNKAGKILRKHCRDYL